MNYINIYYTLMDIISARFEVQVVGGKFFNFFEIEIFIYIDKLKFDMEKINYFESLLGFGTKIRYFA